MDLFLDVLIDSVRDTLNLVPFLLLTYLVMEALEHGAAEQMERVVARADRTGPFVGAVLGALPQCGFSAMAATLYSARVITAGTLVAVILSTSDEMIPVFLAHQESPGRLASILAAKIVVGLVVGLALDAVMRASGHKGDGKAHIHELCERDHCGCDDVDEGAHGTVHAHAAEAEEALDHLLHGDGHEHDHGHGHGHAHGHSHGGHSGSPWAHIGRSALVHTIEVTFFIFLITLAFGFVIELVGQDEIGHLLGIHPVRATLLAALVGLIPNCGASVAITELYLSGTLATGPMLAGLLSSGGVGLLVLWRTNENWRKNLAVTALVYAVGVVSGLVVGATGIIL